MQVLRYVSFLLLGMVVGKLFQLGDLVYALLVVVAIVILGIILPISEIKKTG